MVNKSGTFQGGFAIGRSIRAYDSSIYRRNVDVLADFRNTTLGIRARVTRVGKSVDPARVMFDISFTHRRIRVEFSNSSRSRSILFDVSMGFSKFVFARTRLKYFHCMEKYKLDRISIKNNNEKER